MPGSRTALFSRRQPGGLFAIQDVAAHPGDIWFVCSVTGTDGAGYGVNPDAPFATLSYAIGKATAAKGDVIYLLPGHAESLSGAAAITVNVSGLSIIGLGNGANRPTFTFHTTDAQVVVSAADVLLKNIRCTVDVDEVVSLFSVTAARVTFDTVDFFETASVQAIQFVTCGQDRFVVRNCTHLQAAASASNAKWIQITGGVGVVIEDNDLEIALTSNAASQVIANSAAATNMRVRRNLVMCTGAAAVPVSFHASSTGIAADNRITSGRTTLAGSIALGGLYGAENYAAHTANKNGILDPVADA